MRGKVVNEVELDVEHPSEKSHYGGVLLWWGCLWARAQSRWTLCFGQVIITFPVRVWHSVCVHVPVSVQVWVRVCVCNQVLWDKHVHLHVYYQRLRLYWRLFKWQLLYYYTTTIAHLSSFSLFSVLQIFTDKYLKETNCFKGTVHPRIKGTYSICPLTCRDIHPSRMFWVGCIVLETSAMFVFLSKGELFYLTDVK